MFKGVNLKNGGSPISLAMARPFLSQTTTVACTYNNHNAERVMQQLYLPRLCYLFPQPLASYRPPHGALLSPQTCTWNYHYSSSEYVA